MPECRMPNASRSSFVIIRFGAVSILLRLLLHRSVVCAFERCLSLLLAVTYWLGPFYTILFSLDRRHNANVCANIWAERMSEEYTQYVKGEKRYLHGSGSNWKLLSLFLFMPSSLLFSAVQPASYWPFGMVRMRKHTSTSTQRERCRTFAICSDEILIPADSSKSVHTLLTHVDPNMFVRPLNYGPSMPASAHHSPLGMHHSLRTSCRDECRHTGTVPNGCVGLLAALFMCILPRGQDVIHLHPIVYGRVLVGCEQTAHWFRSLSLRPLSFIFDVCKFNFTIINERHTHTHNALISLQTCNFVDRKLIGNAIRFHQRRRRRRRWEIRVFPENQSQSRDSQRWGLAVHSQRRTFCIF